MSASSRTEHQVSICQCTRRNNVFIEFCLQIELLDANQTTKRCNLASCINSKCEVDCISIDGIAFNEVGVCIDFFDLNGIILCSKCSPGGKCCQSATTIRSVCQINAETTCNTGESPVQVAISDSTSGMSRRKCTRSTCCTASIDFTFIVDFITNNVVLILFPNRNCSLDREFAI